MTHPIQARINSYEDFNYTAADQSPNTSPTRTYTKVNACNLAPNTFFTKDLGYDQCLLSSPEYFLYKD